MPRYFFHIYQGGRHLPDEIGSDLPDENAAWKEATVTVGQILEDLDGALKPGLQWRMEVTDEAGNPICVLRILAERHS
jgi:hypothetical protein